MKAAVVIDIELGGVVRQHTLCAEHMTRQYRRPGTRIVKVHVDDSPPGLTCTGCGKDGAAEKRREQRRAIRAGEMGVTGYGFKAFGESKMDGGIAWVVIGRRVRRDTAGTIAASMGLPVGRHYD